MDSDTIGLKKKEPTEGQHNQSLPYPVSGKQLQKMMMMPKSLGSTSNTSSAPVTSLVCEGSGMKSEVADAESSSGLLRTTEDTKIRTPTGDNSNDGNKPKDSPAFRLRPRRSTPKTPSSYGSPGRPPKVSIFSKHSNFFSESGGAGGKGLESVKRKLLQFLSQSSIKSSDDDTSQEGHDGQHHVTTSSTSSAFFQQKNKKQCLSSSSARHPYSGLSPAQSVKHDVNMGIFMERIRLSDLAVNQTYDKNYVSLRIISILAPKNCHSNPSQTPLPLTSSSGIVTRRRSHEEQQSRQSNMSSPVASNGLLAVASSFPVTHCSSSSSSSQDMILKHAVSSSTAAAASALLTLSLPSPQPEDCSSKNAKQEESPQRRCHDDNAQDGKIFNDHQTEQENRKHVKGSPPKILLDSQQLQDKGVNGQQQQEGKHLKLLVQDADASQDIINWSNAAAVVDIEGCYFDSLTGIEVGNVIEVTKFVTKDAPAGTFSEKSGVMMSSPPTAASHCKTSSTHDTSLRPVKIEVVDVDSDTSIPVLPLQILIHEPLPSSPLPSSSATETAVETLESCSSTAISTSGLPSNHNPSTSIFPFVSIKKKYFSLDNPLLLKVNILGKKPEVPSPGLRFTSKVLRPDEIPGKCGQENEGPAQVKEEKKPASRMMTRRSCSSSSSTSPITSPMTSRCGGGGKIRRGHQV